MKTPFYYGTAFLYMRASVASAQDNRRHSNSGETIMDNDSADKVGLCRSFVWDCPNRIVRRENWALAVYGSGLIDHSENAGKLNLLLF